MKIIDIDRIDIQGETLVYHGKLAMYSVNKAPDGFCGYELHVERRGKNGKLHSAGDFAASSMSVAIASIEDMEMGKEI